MKNAAKRFLNKYDLYAPYLLRKEGALKQEGWFESFRMKAPVDKDFNPIPWMTYSAIHFLDKKVDPAFRVFEYGSGNSTLWWASRVATVYSCEHDHGWYEMISAKMPENVLLKQIDLVYGGNYSREIVNCGKEFDIVVVDGRDRVNCMKHAVEAVAATTVIIVDDSNVADYREGYDYLLGKGYKCIDFEGMGPVTLLLKSTSIFYRAENCLGI